jgi:TatA/E family protein of Tat protein translocase
VTKMPGPMQMLLILAVIIIFFGANKLPQFAKALRQSIDEFKKPSETAVVPDKNAEIKELESKLENLKKQA